MARMEKNICSPNESHKSESMCIYIILLLSILDSEMIAPANSTAKKKKKKKQQRRIQRREACERTIIVNCLYI